MSVLEYSSTVWCFAADTQPKLPHRVFSDARFLTGVVFECGIAHRRYKTRCNQMHPLNSALPVRYAPVLVTRGVLVAHRYTFSIFRCRTLQYRMTFIPLSVSLCDDIADSVFDGVGLVGFKSRANIFSLAYAALSLFVFYYSHSFLSVCCYCGAGVFGLRRCRSLCPSLALHPSFNNNNNKIFQLFQ